MFSAEVANWEAKISAIASRSSCSDLASAYCQYIVRCQVPFPQRRMAGTEGFALRSNLPLAITRACSALMCLSAAFAAFRKASSWLVFVSCTKASVCLSPS